jgi:hypothetical protein
MSSSIIHAKHTRNKTSSRSTENIFDNQTEWPSVGEAQTRASVSRELSSQYNDNMTSTMSKVSSSVSNSTPPSDKSPSSSSPIGTSYLSSVLSSPPPPENILSLQSQNNDSTNSSLSSSHDLTSPKAHYKIQLKISPPSRITTETKGSNVSSRETRTQDRQIFTNENKEDLISTSPSMYVLFL